MTPLWLVKACFDERRKGKDPIKDTERGVHRVAVATVFGVLTTIAAFFPMLLIDNPLGKVLAGFAGIVILTLIFSLIESKFILPAHLAQVSMGQERQVSADPPLGPGTGCGPRRAELGAGSPLPAACLLRRCGSAMPC